MFVLKTILKGGVVLGAAFLLFGSLSVHAQEFDPVFDKLQWRARVLVITGNRDEPLADEQLIELQNAQGGLLDRQVAVLRFREDNLFEVESLSNFDYGGWYDMDAPEQSFMEEQLQTDNNVFSVVLVGLDGEVKNVWLDLVEPQAIFDVIDEMPMRIREMEAAK